MDYMKLMHERAAAEAEADGSIPEELDELLQDPARRYFYEQLTALEAENERLKAQLADWQARLVEAERDTGLLYSLSEAANARAVAAEAERDFQIDRADGLLAQLEDASASIVAAEAEAGKLREALKEYADTANWYVDRESGPAHFGWLGSDPTAIAQLALAPATLQEPGKE